MAATPPGERFLHITALLRTLFDVPLASVTLLDELISYTDAFEPREWRQHRRSDTVCEWVLRQPQPGLLVVEDLAADDRFQHLSMVAGPPRLRFYASAPLVSAGAGAGALRYGTLCVVDVRPRVFPPSHYSMLAHLAGLVAAELEQEAEVRRGEAALAQAQAELRRLAPAVDGSPDAVMVCLVSEPGWPVVYCNEAGAQLAAVPRRPAGLPFWQLFTVVGSFRGEGRQERLQQLVARGRPFALACRQQAPGAAAQQQQQQQQDGSSSGGSGELGSGSSGGGGGGGADPSLQPPPPSPASPRPPLAAAFVPCTAAGLLAGPAAQPSPASTSTDSGSRGTPRPPVIPAPGWEEAALAAPASEPGGGTASGAADEAAAPPSYWLATLRPLPPGGAAGLALRLPGWAGAADAADNATAAAAAAGLSPTSPLATAGSGLLLASPGSASELSWRGGCLPGGGEHMMPPESLREIAIGKLLGAGASGRTYRGVWHGSRVAVKIVEVRDQHGTGGCDEESLYPPRSGSTGCTDLGGGTGSGSGGSGSGGGGAPAALLEALLSKSLSHPHIVPTHAFGVCAHSSGSDSWKEIWIVQELCTLGTLASALEGGRLRDAATQRPRLATVLRTAVEVAGALAYLHSHSVLHGDLTGNNILLSASTKDSRMFVAMVADFGLSRPLDVLSTLNTGTYGTVSHMPPELIIDGHLTSAADVFSFGVVLWEMLSGRRAWAGMSALQIINAVTVQGRGLQPDAGWPASLQGMVRRCLAADPAQRPTARQLLAELEAVLAGGAHVLDAPCEAAPSSGGHLEAPGVPQSPPAVWCALDPSNSRMLHQLFSP